MTTITNANLEHMNNMFPVGTFFTINPKYTVEWGSVMRVTSPFRLYTFNSTNIYGSPTVYSSLQGSFDAWWPDGGYRHYPDYYIWDIKDLTHIIDPNDEDRWALVALGNHVQINKRCYTCGNKRPPIAKFTFK